MRTDEAEQLLINVVEGIVLPEAAQSTDRLRHDDEQIDEGQARPEGSFLLLSAPQSGSTTFTPRTVSTVFGLRFFFPNTPEIKKRVQRYGDVIRAALEGLHGGRTYLDRDGVTQTVPGDLYSLALGDYIPSVTAPNQITAALDLRARYRLTGV